MTGSPLKRFPGVAILLVLLAACTMEGRYEKAENAQDAGREFIRASLDGDYQKARFYLLEDSTNLILMQQQQKHYSRLTGEERISHMEASIRPLNIHRVNDSVTTYRYLNTYNLEDTTTLTIVRVNGEWLVDLKSIITPGHEHVSGQEP